jgi:aspartyl-tRNA(Asn)/glutamyl-tRNA(Gln) amidotransferase subunit B
MGGLTEKKMTIKDIKFTPENFAELISLIYTEKINSTNAQKILVRMLEHDRDIDPTHIMEEEGLGQVRDTGALGTIVDEVIKSYPKQVADFKAGKEPILKFLIGMAMKATEGSADPKMLEELLREKIKSK